MSKMLVIDNCRVCSFYALLLTRPMCFCVKPARYLPLKKSIPSWCPLPDYDPDFDAPDEGQAEKDVEAERESFLRNMDDCRPEKPEKEAK